MSLSSAIWWTYIYGIVFASTHNMPNLKIVCHCHYSDQQQRRIIVIYMCQGSIVTIFLTHIHNGKIEKANTIKWYSIAPDGDTNCFSSIRIWFNCHIIYTMRNCRTSLWRYLSHVFCFIMLDWLAFFCDDSSKWRVDIMDIYTESFQFYSSIWVVSFFDFVMKWPSMRVAWK